MIFHIITKNTKCTENLYFSRKNVTVYIGGTDKYITRETNIFSQLVRKALNLKHDFTGWKYMISSYLYLSWKKFAKYYIDFTYIYGNV